MESKKIKAKITVPASKMESIEPYLAVHTGTGVEQYVENNPNRGAKKILEAESIKGDIFNEDKK